MALPKRARYQPTDLTFVVPTKDRPDKIRSMLACLQRQTVTGFRVVIVDGGTSAKPVVDDYHPHLKITYIQSPVASQIHQRNLGIAQLNANDHLVGFIDDDMALAGNSIEKVLALWNSIDPNPGGIGFNLDNESAEGPNLLKRVFLLDKGKPGQVLASGANVGIGNIRQSIKAQWLGGGYTIWRKDVILSNPHLTVKTKWAIGEDLRFSYPIGKKYPLWVCAEARATHNHIYKKADLVQNAKYRGQKISMASLFFVRSHKEFSISACYWMLAGLCLGRILRGIRERQRYLLLESIGIATGLVGSMISGADRDYLLSQMEN